MAAASLGRLTLDLLVKLGSFEQGMTQAERKTKQTTDNMNKAFAGFKQQVMDALGGTQIGSVIDNFTGKLGLGSIGRSCTCRDGCWWYCYRYGRSL